MPDQAVTDAITAMARRHGIDPATAMAIAERESSFNVRSGSGSPYSSAYGLFQLLKGERAKYGGSSNDPEEQSEAWGRYADDLKSEMTSRLGREPTGPEFYMGHLIGGTRAARVVSGTYHPETPIDAVFTPKERAANPFFDRAGTVGNLSSSVMGDIDRRTKKFSIGGAESGAPAQSGAPDFSSFSEAVGGEI
jgi:Transglycosylase SLT domain